MPRVEISHANRQIRVIAHHDDGRTVVTYQRDQPTGASVGGAGFVPGAELVWVWESWSAYGDASFVFLIFDANTGVRLGQTIARDLDFHGCSGAFSADGQTVYLPRASYGAPVSGFEAFSVPFLSSIGEVPRLPEGQHVVWLSSR